MNSILYSSPITVKSDTVVKAIATRTRYSRSNVCTHEVIMENSSNMILIFDINSGNHVLSLPILNSYIPDGGSIRISWGDGEHDNHSNADATDNTHTYSEDGVYRVSITGTMTQFGYGDLEWIYGCERLTSVVSFGSGLGLTSLSGAFNGCVSLANVPLNTFPGTVTDTSYMFKGCSEFNASIGEWDTSNVIDMNSMFRGCTTFNIDISMWDTSSVEDMSYMFHDCTAFNQDVSWHSGLSWNISKVADMASFATGTCGIDSEHIEEILRGAYDLSLSEYGMISGVTFNSGNKPDYSDTSVQTYLIALETSNGWVFDTWRYPIPALEDLIIDLQCDYGLTGTPITGWTSNTEDGQSYACSANHHSVSSSTLNGINVLDTTTGIYSAQFDYGTNPESFIEDDVTVALLFKTKIALGESYVTTLFKAGGWDDWNPPHLGDYFGLYLSNLWGDGQMLYLQSASGRYNGEIRYESSWMNLPVITNNVWHMVIVTYTRSTKIYNIYTEYDDGATAVKTKTCVFEPYNYRNIGTYEIGEAGKSGNHAMTMVWKKALTEAERKELIAYKKNKYGAV